MKTTTTILIFLLLPLVAFPKVSFFQGSLNEAQRAAAIEGKLYFIDFYATYCLPCKLMDETTFMDKDLANYIHGNYVPLKLNIDAFDAYEVRSKYEVNALPTVMIFSSSGELLESYEGALTASSLYKMLERHNLPQNRQKTTPPPFDESNIEIANAATTSRRRTRPAVQTPEPEPMIKPEPAPTPTPLETVKESKAEIILSEKELNSTMKPILPPITRPIVKKEMAQPKLTGLYEFSAAKHPSKGYVIQIGVFAEYGNVLVEVEKLQQLFPERKVIVHIDDMNGKTVYRVAVGTFTTYIAAKGYLRKVKGAKIDGFIKNLASLK